MLNGVFPIRFLFRISLGRLAATHQGIGKVVRRIFMQSLIVT